MKNISSIHLITILISFLCYGCTYDCKNYTPKDNYNSINPDDLALVPYNGLDSLFFLRNNIDTITLFGNGKLRYETVENGNLGSCGPTSTEHNENFQYNFNPKITAEKLKIDIRYPGYLDFYFLNRHFVSDLVHLGPPFGLPQITINNKEYKDIEIIYSTKNDTIYFDLEFGIVKFGFLSGEQWTLLNKK